jgi:hypothetical protein
MNTDFNNISWGLAFVRETPLPPYKKWREVMYFTYIINGAAIDKTKFYIGKRADRTINIEAIKSRPVLDSFLNNNIKISTDETIFIDWNGNYFIGKKRDYYLPQNRVIIHRKKRKPIEEDEEEWIIKAGAI